MLTYDYDETHDDFAVPLPHTIKHLPTEEAAWLFCAERNGVKLPTGARAEQKRKARHKFARAALLEDRPPWPVEEAEPEPAVDVSILDENAREAIKAIRELDPGNIERAALVKAEKAGKNRKSVLAALEG